MGETFSSFHPLFSFSRHRQTLRTVQDYMKRLKDWNYLSLRMKIDKQKLSVLKSFGVIVLPKLL